MVYGDVMKDKISGTIKWCVIKQCYKGSTPPADVPAVKNKTPFESGVLLLLKQLVKL